MDGNLVGNDRGWIGSSRLIHGVFNTQDDVLAAFKARCVAKRIDFGKFSWVGSETAPGFDPNDPEIVVVLDATLDTLQNTFEFAWEWTKDGQEDSWRLGPKSDAKHLRLLSDERPDDAEGDSPDFKSWTLSWKRIKLDTNIGESRHVISPISPGCVLLFVAAEHPERIRAVDNEKRFGFWLGGLQCRSSPNAIGWEDFPCVSYDDESGSVGLSTYWGAAPYYDHAFPSFLEELDSRNSDLEIRKES